MRYDIERGDPPWTSSQTLTATVALSPQPTEAVRRAWETLFVDVFDDDVALGAGQWDRRFARVLAKSVNGTSAAALIDASGAAGGVAYENIETYAWDGTVWMCTSSSGFGGESGWSGGMAHIGGTAAAGRKVVVEFRSERHEVEVQPTGYWLFAVASDGSDDDMPKRVR